MTTNGALRPTSVGPERSQEVVIDEDAAQVVKRILCRSARREKAEPEKKSRLLLEKGKELEKKTPTAYKQREGRKTPAAGPRRTSSSGQTISTVA